MELVSETRCSFGTHTSSTNLRTWPSRCSRVSASSAIEITPEASVSLPHASVFINRLLNSFHRPPRLQPETFLACCPCPERRPSRVEQLDVPAGKPVWTGAEKGEQRAPEV